MNTRNIVRINLIKRGIFKHFKDILNPTKCIEDGKKVENMYREYGGDGFWDYQHQSLKRADAIANFRERIC